MKSETLILKGNSDNIYLLNLNGTYFKFIDIFYCIFILNREQFYTKFIIAPSYIFVQVKHRHERLSLNAIAG